VIGWSLARLIPGHSRPFFAPIAAVIALNAAAGRRGRQAVELIAGVAIGIGVADLLARAIGTGAWQLGVVVLLALAIPRALGAGPVVVTQSAASGIIVVAVQRTHSGFTPSRFVDALVGGGVALVFTQLLFPTDPVKLLRGATRATMRELAEILRLAASSIAEHDVAVADQALARAQRLDDDALREAARIARSTVRSVPTRRRRRQGLAPYLKVVDEVDALQRHAIIFATAALRLARDDTREPSAALVEGMNTIAAGAETVVDAAGEPKRMPELRDALLRGATEARTALAERDGIAGPVARVEIARLTRDLLRAAGVSADEAEDMQTVSATVRS
jgi:uncharacterized membrane protein YgaE (UPF0421/DUF939 family)